MPQDSPATSTAPCLCGLPASYDECCERFHRGDAQAPTAERLMRSRFSAFCVKNEDYLLRTWHPSTRLPHVGFDKGLRWQRLEVLKTAGGGFLDAEGTVHFVAHYIERGRPGQMEEHSRFVVQDGAWLYVGPLAAR